MKREPKGSLFYWSKLGLVIRILYFRKNKPNNLNLMKLRVFSSALVYCLFALLLVSCQQSPETYRQKIDLQGEWQFALDTAQTGIEQHWYSTNLADSVQLPGTTDLNLKGFLNTDTTTMHLNRIYKYEGPAWYRRKCPFRKVS